MVATARLQPLPPAASVVIIGGGVVGVALAFHLAEAGVTDVVLLERAGLGSGSTCRAAGGVRAQFSDEVNIRLGARGLAAYARFPCRPGQEIDLRRVGYLFLLSEPDHVADFERHVALQNRLGVPSRLIDARAARRLSPLVETGDVLAAAFSPDDGHCTPESVVLGYATAARRLGATLLTGTTVVGLEVAGDEVRAVRTDRGPIRAGTVVCAAGAWSGGVGAMAGVDLPVTPLRRQVVFTGPVPDLPPALPMTIDFSSSFYFHREGPGLLVGMSDPAEEPGFHLRYSDAWVPRLTEVIARRAPALLDVGLHGGWAGLYEVTPDHNALIGRAAHPSNFLYATGFSGHGFLQAPAVAEVVRDLCLGRTPFVDVGPLSADRFRADAPAPRPETNVV
ncbi:NAD(P)/FAD-dependent oxidoreductase [Saccharothrix australiensis]|uniref:Glycine/D-amino acid oxidase-like deaminating enzyme n=1 Tax=Saccharothrix australiensis TaxID=2072 RepID=A0A495VZM6_9PSEU|nr:FAD-binding oxidoreductase [Saccharothrix australiensis]RKT54902.1 glycine/D-amino acid oxidase-like deaminating enzyme [Saccharothrix australiensis]